MNMNMEDNLWDQKIAKKTNIKRSTETLQIDPNEVNK